MGNAIERMLDFASQQKNVYLYGTGYLGTLIYATLEQAGVKVNAFLHSDGYPVFANSMPDGCVALPLSELPEAECGVIVTTFPKHYPTVLNNLDNLCKSRESKLEVFCPERSSCSDSTANEDFEEFLGVAGIAGLAGVVGVAGVALPNVTARYFALNNVVLPNFFNNGSYGIDAHSRYAFCREVLDIIAGRCHDEGPYEYGSVRVLADDIVFDLGANFGVFSALAASRGASVFAFEPLPQNVALLKNTVDNYPNVEIVESAVSDLTGNVEFSLGWSTASHISSIGRETPTGGRGDSITVKSITLDEFVAKNKITHVDFIKSDIEGAERNMLLGAQDVLRRFAPKLALCTYHFKDDIKVMTDLILKANPEYKVLYRWRKLYAYVPKGGTR